LSSPKAQLFSIQVPQRTNAMWHLAPTVRWVNWPGLHGLQQGMPHDVRLVPAACPSVVVGELNSAIPSLSPGPTIRAYTGSAAALGRCVNTPTRNRSILSRPRSRSSPCTILDCVANLDLRRKSTEVVIRPRTQTLPLARPKLLRSFRFFLRPGGSRPAPVVIPLLLTFVLHH
jgi:hypothetical protein